MAQAAASSRPLALVTGPTSGIGAVFARELAKRGYDLVLVARDAARLEETAALLSGLGAAAEVIVADLAEGDDLERVEQRLRREPAVELLVNNAGFGMAEAFVVEDIARQERMIRVHVVATVRLTHAALLGMLRRRHGRVINVSSVAAFAPMPMNATYAATKTYLNSFSESLDVEVRDFGVRVQALCAGFTRTELHARANIPRRGVPAWMWLSPEQVVHESLAALGRGGVVLVPGLAYRALVAVMRLVPSSLLARLVGGGLKAKLRRHIERAVGA